MMQDLKDLLERKVNLATADALRPGFKDRILQDAIAL
jgi:predicted nucleotidyltransferase